MMVLLSFDYNVLLVILLFQYGFLMVFVIIGQIAIAVMALINRSWVSMTSYCYHCLHWEVGYSTTIAGVPILALFNQSTIQTMHITLIL